MQGGMRMRQCSASHNTTFRLKNQAKVLQNCTMKDNKHSLGVGLNLKSAVFPTSMLAQEIAKTANIGVELASMQTAFRSWEGIRKQIGTIENLRGILAATEKMGLPADISRRVVPESLSSLIEKIQFNPEIGNILKKIEPISLPLPVSIGIIGSGISNNPIIGEYFKSVVGNLKIQPAGSISEKWSASDGALISAIENFKRSFADSSMQELWAGVAKASDFYDVDETQPEPSLLDADGAREEIGQLVYGVTEGISKALTTQEAVDMIIQGVNSAREPRNRWILVSIFFPLLLWLVSPFFNSYVDFHMKKNLEGTSTQATNKQVKEAAREAVGDLRLLRDYRFVTAQSLAVRAEPKARGQTLGQLRLGQTVHVLGKERDFTLVTWRSEDGSAQLQGWVFSRYLKRFQ